MADFQIYNLKESDYEGIIGDVLTIGRGDTLNNTRPNFNSMTEEERNNCLKMADLAMGFNEYDCATVLNIINQKFPYLVMQSVAERWLKLESIVEQHRNIANEGES